MDSNNTTSLSNFLAGRPEYSLMLFHHFIDEFESIGDIIVEPAKTMIGISNSHHRIAWVTQFGKNFLHVVLPFKQPYPDNLCFQKIGQVPGQVQYNHHFRMLQKDDINDEVREFMRLAYRDEL